MGFVSYFLLSVVLCVQHVVSSCGCEHHRCVERAHVVFGLGYASTKSFSSPCSIVLQTHNGFFHFFFPTPLVSLQAVLRMMCLASISVSQGNNAGFGR